MPNSISLHKITNLLPTLIEEVGKAGAREYLRRHFAKRENIMDFAYICFSHHFTKVSPPFHYEVMELLGRPNHVGVAAPRGHAKSTLLLIDDAFDIVNANKHYIVKVSDTYTQALEHTQGLQNELENNEMLQWIYGDLKTDNWASGEFVTTTGVKVVAKGQGTKVRGLKYNQYRPDKINIDDLENDELVANADRRNKLKNWFMLGVLPALAKGGKVNMVGTILHGDSLLSQIINTDEFSGWTKAKYKAVQDGKALWPDMYSIDYLTGMRDNPAHERYLGHIVFSQEYQNEPISESEAIIKRAWIKYYQELPEMKERIITVDPAISKSDKADFTAIQCWGLGIDGNAYCLEATAKRLSFKEQGYEIRAMYHRHKPDRVVIEEVAYQSALKESDELNDLPVKGVVPDKDKRKRLIVVSKFFEGGKIYLNSTQQTLFEQLVNFGSTAHDDEVDACVYAVSYLMGIYGKFDFKKDLFFT